MEPLDRAWLHQRIAQRFDAMLAAGFLQEVMGLRSRGDLQPTLPSMRCVGYRQAWELLEGQTPGAPLALQQLREKGIYATRQLAKRQLTWLRSMTGRQLVHCDAPGTLDQLMAIVRTLP